jgi:hypothetical protein
VLPLLEGTAGWWTQYSDLIDDTFETLLVLEESADRLSSHLAGLIPGLLQTREYSWELIGTKTDQPLDQVERLVELRQARRQALDREPRPLVTVILDEAALRRPVGGTAVMREQYEWLIAAAGKPGLNLQVRPLTAGPHRATGFTFHLFDFVSDRPMVQIEMLDREYFIDSAVKIERYRDAFSQALAGALDPVDSVRFISGLAARC